METDILFFSLDDKNFFGIETLNILEIIKDKKITSYPNASKYLIGIMNVRDKIDGVFDLARILNIESEHERNYFLICTKDNDNIDADRVIFPVNEVTAIVKVREENKVDKKELTFLSDYVKYVIKHDDGKLIAVLDLDKIYQML